MIDKLPTLELLIKQLQHIPYLASKNIYKVADYLLSLNEEKLELLCDALKAAHANIIPCSRCFAWQEKDAQCLLCNNARRDQSVICVVETWQELISIEKTAGYAGLYHVLGGAICPLEGIGPEDLTIDNLLSRITGDQIKEVILATNQTPEGEATAAYLAMKLKHSGVTITCLARGIPVGSSLEYMDRLTVYKALSERRPY